MPTKRASPKSKKPAGKRPPAKPAAKRRGQGFGVGGEALGVLIVGAGAYALYDAISSAEGAIALTLQRLGGALWFLLPPVAIWIGLLVIFSRRYAKNYGRIAAFSALLLMLFAAFQLFAMEGVQANATFPISKFPKGYIDSIALSYAPGREGGGALGAVIAAPLYEWFGPKGGLIALIALMLVDLILLRVLSLRGIAARAASAVAGLRDRRASSRGERRGYEGAEPRSRRDGEREFKPIRYCPPSEESKRGRVPSFLNRANAGAPPPSEEKAEPDPPAPNEPWPIEASEGENADRAPEAAAKRPPRRKAPKPPEPEKKRRLDGTPEPEPEEAETERRDQSGYHYPPIDLLEEPRPVYRNRSEQGDREKGKKLEETLRDFGIAATVKDIAHGPTVTRFELSPAPGIKVSRITALADDIAMNLKAMSVRIEAPIPGKAAVGVEVPNDEKEIVTLREVLESSEARGEKSPLAVALGKDNAGKYVVADLSKMPHVLIAGATGAGKSVCINCIICSILYRATPEEVRMIMIDPKVVELNGYNGIPHLETPVVTDPKKATLALNKAVAIMDSRYKKFAERGVRDIKGYNQTCKGEEMPLPLIIIIIDELSDLMVVAPGDVENSIFRLAQLARAAGIHLVIATQRPSVNVVTGVIKANIPSRIAFTVASQVDSRTIIDYAGAEKLLGRGDMLFAPSGTNKSQRIQGAWVSEEEVRDIVEHIRDLHEENYNEELTESLNEEAETEGGSADPEGERDALLEQAIETVVESGQASISMLQRRLRIGYARAGRLIDDMARLGFVGPADGAKPREVILTREEFELRGEHGRTP